MRRTTVSKRANQCCREPALPFMELTTTNHTSAGEEPLVSVVIPAYNCERYIAQTLASVLAQTHGAIEVLVVDDGSTDRTPSIVAEHGHPVRLIRQANQGVCVARNKGFEASRGEYVCFLDHDDYWFPWKLRRQIEAFGAHPQTGVVCTDFAAWLPVESVFPDPAALAPNYDLPPTVDEVFSGWVYHSFLIDGWALMSTAMFRREVLARCGGFDRALPYSEDWDLFLRLSRNYPFIKLSPASTLYRQHPDQGSRKLRDIDYRTRLLESASRDWGLVSRDGRGVDPAVFRQNLACFHMQFALHHLEHGGIRVAVRSLLRAWRLHPLRVKYVVLIGAAMAGWRPKPTP